MKDYAKVYKILNILAPIISILSILALWAISAKIIDSEYILPTISSAVKSFINLFTFREFYLSLLGTLVRTLMAFLFSFLVAFVLAILTKKYPLSQRFIQPIIMIIRVLPTVAVVLLLLFWTNNNVAPMIVTVLVVLPSTYTGIKTALSVVDQKQLEMCKLYNVSSKTVIFKVQIPQILPEMLLVMGGGLALNLKLMVAAEVLSQTVNSIGILLNTTKAYFEISTMIALVLVTVILGLIIEALFNLASKKAGKWK